MSEQRTVLLERVDLKQGVSQKSGKPYEQTVISWNGEDGERKFASAFGNGLYEHAKKLEGQGAIVDLEQNGNFLNLVAIRPAAQKPPEPKLGTGDYVTGQKPVIETRRMCAMNAANNAGPMSAELLSFQTGQEVTKDLYMAAWDACFEHCFLQLLRKCKAIEDEDIPF